MGDRLRGKVAVVTGAGGLGIGQGCALAFAREGADVVGCDVDKKAAAETEALITGEGLTYKTFIADLTDPKARWGPTTTGWSYRWCSARTAT